jgi:hypothetical protein
MLREPSIRKGLARAEDAAGPETQRWIAKMPSTSNAQRRADQAFNTADRTMSEQCLAGLAIIRPLIAAGLLKPTSGYGIEQHDEYVALVKHMAGIERLSGQEFSRACYLLTPPEFRK